MTKRLEDIGFYTLSDARAAQASATSPLYRCELILTDRCNFKCPYCRGLRPNLRGDLPWDQAVQTLRYWLADGLKNVRFSGGEPTLYPGLADLVKQCRAGGVERIAVSTNGSAAMERYYELIEAGVNDFSISLDSGCCATGDQMAGGVPGAWAKTTETIRALSKLTYVSVGMVFNEHNVLDALESVRFADSLGVSDIRIIPSAQYNQALRKLTELPRDLLAKYRILDYRIASIKQGKHVRGLELTDSSRCSLVLDDQAVAQSWHFPCIIYMREGGRPIGRVGPGMRQERAQWAAGHNTHDDPICSTNCLDVCREYNNRCGK